MYFVNVFSAFRLSRPPAAETTAGLSARARRHAAVARPRAREQLPVIRAVAVREMDGISDLQFVWRPIGPRSSKAWRVRAWLSFGSRRAGCRVVLEGGLVGGGDRGERAGRRVVDLGGGERSHDLVVTLACGDEDTAIGEQGGLLEGARVGHRAGRGEFARLGVVDLG